jgi:hypothetical protein
MEDSNQEMKGVYPYQYKKNKQKDSIIMNTEKVA